MHPPLLVLVVILVSAVVFVVWSSRWGSTRGERVAHLSGDAFFLDEPGTFRASLTRAVSIDAPPQAVWPWIAQLGRGAGWYSVDFLDNGRIDSARHLVGWIPEPRLGDASPIGYLRHLVPGRSMSWWIPGLSFLGARTRLAVDFEIRAQDGGSRLVSRMSVDASGWTAPFALLVFLFIDGVMAVRQLVCLRDRVERFGNRTLDPDRPETGDRAQFQLYQVIYASGETAGVPGKEQAARWRRAAAEAGLVDSAAEEPNPE